MARRAPDPGDRILALTMLLVAMAGNAAAQERDPPAAPEPPFHVVFVSHSGAANGAKVAEAIAAAAAAARRDGTRVAYVMEWAGPAMTWERWQEIDPSLRDISKEAFVSLDPVKAVQQGDLSTYRRVLDAWIRAREDVAARVRTTLSIGTDANPFAKEVNRALREAKDVLADCQVEGSYPAEGLAPIERLGKDMEVFGHWLRAYQCLSWSQLLANNELTRALDAGDAARFRAGGRRALRVHVDSIAARNRVMTATLLALRAWREKRPGLRVVLFYGFAHGAFPTLQEALGDDLRVTTVAPVIGRYDDLGEFYRDLDAFFARGDGSDPERLAIARFLAPPDTEHEPAYYADRDAILSALVPEEIDAFLASMRGLKDVGEADRPRHLQKAFVDFVSGLPARPGLESQAKALAARWFARTPESPCARAGRVLALNRAFATGGADPAAAGDLLLEGVLDRGGARFAYRALIRRSPFGYREEFTAEGRPSLVYVSDGTQAWGLAPDGASAPMPGYAAVSFLESAFLARMGWLEAGWAAEETAVAVRLPSGPALPEGLPAGRACTGIEVDMPPGTCWRFDFDDADGRLHGIAEIGVQAPRFTRFADWRRAGAVQLPALSIQGRAGDPAGQVLRLEKIEAVSAHAPELFAGNPAPPVAPVSTPLAVVCDDLPGAASVIVPDVRIDGRGSAPAFFDTGISDVGLDRTFAAGIGISAFAASGVHTPSGPAAVEIGWIEELAAGPIRLLQVPASLITLPPAGTLPRVLQPRITFGGPRVLALSPLLDLEGLRLTLRGPAAAPGGRRGPEAGRPVLRVPLEWSSVKRRHLLAKVFVDDAKEPITVMLDTGSAGVLQITQRGLERLGLPLTPGAWLERGALSAVVGGVGGAMTPVFVTTFERVRLGPVAYERPWVVVAPSVSGQAMDGYLGCGAILPFAGAAIDAATPALELLPPEGTGGPAAGGPFVVPAPGRFLGVCLGPGPGPEAAPPSWPVLGVYSGSSAERAGVQAGDILERIDGEPPPGTLSDARRRLWIGEGARVRLALRRASGEPFSVDLP